MPPMISMTFTNARYPVGNKAAMNNLCGASAGDGSAGIGMKFRKKLSPKTMNNSPRRPPAMLVASFMMFDGVDVVGQ
jgi:hypothetical protein